MNKLQFLDELRRHLSGLPQSDLDERLLFYSEMIDDRVEDGLTEEEAVAGIGPVDEVVEQIMAETPLSRLIKVKVKQRRSLKVWELVLLVLGSPVWLPLLIAAFAVCLSLYIVLWAVLISLWAVVLSLAVGAVGALFMAAYEVMKSNAAGGGFMLGTAFVCAGIAILLFFGCLALSKGLLRLTQKMLLAVKAMFLGKESAKQ
ncbi:MAG: DUF1700 domain-containing protein [Oscillospiraceae bacterium]|nr:DUF1700 domain-containing protein [Oscillospiraceae bacterium]MBR0392846.1 DUF1700 domain-containing protein [Oscillospiraceae bacterium]